MKSLNLTYLEFYSGVGGWTLALNEAKKRINRKRDIHMTLQLQRLAFFDHSNLCNHVFQYNFSSSQGHNISCANDSEKEVKPMAIEKLTIGQLEQYKASIWVLSPPCQPHTRQHSNQNQDLQDPRSRSFLHICSLLEKLTLDTLPKLIFLENVIGFEKSNSFYRWRKVLSSRQYAVAHFHLTPTQCLIPNDRPRYYCIAVLVSNEYLSSYQPYQSSFLSYITSVIQCETILDNSSPIIHTEIEPLGVLDTKNLPTEEIRPISDFVDTNLDDSIRAQVLIPPSLLHSSASWCFDIIRPCDKRSSCFTHSYGKFARGTGSVLYVGALDTYSEETNKRREDNPDDICGSSNRTLLECIQLVSPEERKFDANWSTLLPSDNDIRYLTGTEMARLMGFPVNIKNPQEEDEDTLTFRFPPNVTMKQQWKLIGNSLNVTIASSVVELGFSYFIHLYLK